MYWLKIIARTDQVSFTDGSQNYLKDWSDVCENEIAGKLTDWKQIDHLPLLIVIGSWSPPTNLFFHNSR